MSAAYYRHPDAPPEPPHVRTPRDGIEYIPSANYPETRSHGDPPFPNDLTFFPHAMTDIHAHVLVNDLISHDMSTVRLAREWHITHAHAETPGCHWFPRIP